MQRWNQNDAICTLHLRVAPIQTAAHEFRTLHPVSCLQADLKAYADRHGLPPAYVPAFMGAVAAKSAADAGGDPGGTANPGTSPDSQAAAPQQRIPFEAFRKFVASREAGLRTTFDAMDANGDGESFVQLHQTNHTTFLHLSLPQRHLPPVRVHWALIMFSCCVSAAFPVDQQLLCPCNSSCHRRFNLTSSLRSERLQAC